MFYNGYIVTMVDFNLALILSKMSDCLQTNNSTGKII